MNSAAAMAIVKITQLKGLADKSDYTCMFLWEGPTFGHKLTQLHRRHRRIGSLDKVSH